MEKMLVVVFDNETKAYEGSHALKQLDGEGSITVHAESVIKKGADGTVSVKQADGISLSGLSGEQPLAAL